MKERTGGDGKNQKSQIEKSQMNLSKEEMSKKNTAVAVEDTTETVETETETVEVAPKLSRREKRAASLAALIMGVDPEEDGSVRIPIADLQAAGWSRSSWVHRPYWKGTNPGAVSLSDVGFSGGLSIKKDQGPLLVVRPIPPTDS
jgi:hypothetical protein